jgi:hypothetical protein
MSIALDYTYRIDPTALKAAGASMVCRYLKPDSAPAYRIGLKEYRELVGAGIQVTLNWEYDDRDWLGGATRGATHGSLAVQQARALGYPAGRVIVGSADFDMTRSEWTGAGRSYAWAFAIAVTDGGYRPGVYGPWDVLTWVREEGIMDAFWQARMSWAFSQGRNAHDWPGAHLIQRRHITVGGQDCDLNDIMIQNWGDDMEQAEKVVGTLSRGNTVGDVFADVSNQRDWWYDQPTGTVSRNPPPKDSRADTVVRVAIATPIMIDTLTKKVDALAAEIEALQAGQVSQDAVDAAVAKALAAQTPALVKAINDDAARRAAE